MGRRGGVPARQAAVLALSVMMGAGAVRVAAAPAPAPNKPPVIVQLGPPTSGKAFACRMRATIRYAGSPPLTRIDLIAEVYENGKYLASSGLTSGDRPLIRAEDGGAPDTYVPTALQLDLTPEICRNMDALGIAYARCKFGQKPSVACLDRLHVEGGGNSLRIFIKR